MKPTYLVRSIVRLLAPVTLLVVSTGSEAREWFVAKTGADINPGDAARPLSTIQRAAELAEPGDTVTVRAGIYRERVDPRRGGTVDAPIVYRAQPGADVRIMGSEPVTAWIRSGALWKARLPRKFFGEFNPFAASIKHPKPVRDGSPGDWGWLRYGRWAHRGNVYLDGDGLTETETAAGLARPMTWHAEIDGDGVTTIFANFGDRDPTVRRVEVNVRPTLFYPTTPGLSHIHVRGFTLMNAATHWAPPTVEQLAAIGPNGGHHWVIEDNVILNSKGSCLSIGMPSGPADRDKAGYHVIRNNVIMRCGQAGIIGQAWNSHSLIQGNDIEDINHRLEYGGAETGGIKLHYSHDTVIEGNLVRNIFTIDAALANADGIWLDARNVNDIVRNNVIVGAMGAAILMEANWAGPNTVENNLLVGGQAATYSSRDTAWKHNMLVDSPGRWVNQTDLGRPDIAGAVWSRNLFIGSDVAQGPDAARENLYLGGGKPRAGEDGAIAAAGDPAFEIDFAGPAVRIRLHLPAEAWRAARSTPATGRDFFGAPRSDGFAYGPFGKLRAGPNALTVFRYSPRRNQALRMITGR